MLSTPSLVDLTDTALLDSLHALITRGRHFEVELLRHLAEVERRDLHHARGYSSLFVYCTDALGFEKHATYNRITVARLARRFPRVLTMLQTGQLTLTAAKTLGPQLDNSNADELLDAGAGKTVDEIRVLLAERNPKPPAPTTVRKLPTPKKQETGPSAAPLFEQASAERVASNPRPRKPAPKPEPLSKDSYKVTFTGSAEFVGMLEEVVTLLSQAGGKKVEEADAIETAMRELRDRLRKRKYAVGARPKKSKKKRTPREGAPARARRTRRIPNAVRRAVAERDGFQCSYVDPETGRRCCETRFLEYQHCDAFSEGGAHSEENLKLFCRGHNQFAGRRDGLIGEGWRVRVPDRAVDTAAAAGPGHSLWTAERAG